MSGAKIIMTDEDLIKLVLSKNRAGAEALYDRYAQVLFLAIIRISPQKHIAEGILQQTFVKAWHSFENYPPEKQTVLVWMMSLARNVAKGSAV